MRPSLIILAGTALASIGDRLLNFRDCVTHCEQIECVGKEPFLPEYDVFPIIRMLIWPCRDNCDYKCREHVTDSLKATPGQKMVQFYGKWPFHRVFGVTELFSTLFSGMNLYANYLQLGKVASYIKLTSDRGGNLTMIKQYQLLLYVSIFGWLGSTLFHIRDIPILETWDYFGAGAIMVANLNAIFIRYFHLFDEERRKTRYIFQAILTAFLISHYTKLLRHWDYSYNMSVNVLVGLTSAFLWIGHSLKVNGKYQENKHIYNSSMQLLPFETRIMTKLNYIGRFRTGSVPLIPMMLNIYLIVSLSLESLDFEPWFRLIDAHSLWHLATIFPPLIWFDWNIWDVEMNSVFKLQ